MRCQSHFNNACCNDNALNIDKSMRKNTSKSNLVLCLPVSCAGNVCKQFELTHIRSYRMLDIMWIQAVCCLLFFNGKDTDL